MNLKYFLKSNKEKLILAFVLLVVSSIAFRAGPFTPQHMGAVPVYFYGYPIPFIPISDSMVIAFLPDTPLVIILAVGLDFAFWYVVSLLVFAMLARYPVPKNMRKDWVSAKGFLRKKFAPSRSRIILTMLLFFISSYFSASTYQTHADTLTGPVPIGGPTLISTGYPLMYFHATREGLIFTNLIIDVTFWYVISSLAIVLFSKYSTPQNVKKRGKNPTVS